MCTYIDTHANRWKRALLYFVCNNVETRVIKTWKSLKHYWGHVLCRVVASVLSAKSHSQPIPTVDTLPQPKQCGTEAAVRHVQTKARDITSANPSGEAGDLTENKSSISKVWRRRGNFRGFVGSPECYLGGFRTDWRYRHTMLFVEMLRNRAVYWQEYGDTICIMIQGLRFNIYIRYVAILFWWLWLHFCKLLRNLSIVNIPRKACSLHYVTSSVETLLFCPTVAHIDSNCVYLGVLSINR